MFRMKPRAVGPIACAVASLIMTASAERAYALSCALPGFIAPIPDSVQVPTNTLVWCTKGAETSSPPVRLRDAAGAEVSGTETQLSMYGYAMLVFRPDSELAPNTRYTVECPARYPDEPSSVFTTGAGARTSPPAVPSVSRIETHAYPEGAWGASYYALFRDAGEAGSIVVVDLARGASLEADDPSGSVADAAHFFLASDVFVGTGPCGGSWPGATLGASTTVALGAFDETGAFSGWSETVTVTIPGEATVDRNGEVIEPAAAARPSLVGRSGCALGGRGSSLGAVAGLLLAFAGLAARRRRSS